ncbi:hypothetical protein [Actinokineospora sp. NPDC004072]
MITRQDAGMVNASVEEPEGAAGFVQLAWIPETVKRVGRRASVSGGWYVVTSVPAHACTSAAACADDPTSAQPPASKGNRIGPVTHGDTYQRRRIPIRACMRMRSAITAILTTTALAVPTTAHAEQARHCVVSLADGTTTCHASFRAAITAATGGRVTSAPRGPAIDPAFTDAVNRAAGTMADPGSTVIGIEYSSDDYEGSSLIYSAPWGCDPDKEFDYPDWIAASLPSGWNDEIESFRTYAGCAALHFLHANRGGPALGYWYSWGDLYWLNDEVSSIAWS